MKTTEEWRKQLDFLTLETAVIFLRNLQGHAEFQYKKFQVLCWDGYKRLDASDLCLNFNPQAPAATIGSVSFSGGPSRYQSCKGNYLTFIIDCVMVVQTAKGVEFVNATVDYVRGFSQITLPKPAIFYDKICHLIRALHNTVKSIEHGLEDVGLIDTDYDLDDVEEKLLEAGLGQCETCGLWFQIEKFDGVCDTCERQSNEVILL